MTVIVGVLCTDGVVVGADSSATFTAGELSTIEQPITKLFVLNEAVLVAFTGQVGLNQRFLEVARRETKKGQFASSTALTNAKNLAQAAKADFSSTQVEYNQYGALVAFGSEKAAHLVEFALRDFQPELKNNEIWFASMGAGQRLADPFLALLRRLLFKDMQPKRREGIFAVLWALQHAIDLNTGGIKGPATIGEMYFDQQQNKPIARILNSDELAEHEANIEAAERHFAKYRDMIAGIAAADPQPSAPPSPPAS